MPLLTSYSFLVTLFLMIGYENPMRAQTIPDSLSQKLLHAMNDSVKARTILDIGEAIEAESPKKSLEYYLQALELGREIKNARLQLSAMVDVGISYIEANELDNALSIFSEAIPVARQINDTGKIAAVYANIGNVYLHHKKPVKAIEYYLLTARLLESCHDQIRLPSLYSNLCSLLDDQQDFEKSIEYGNRAFDLAQKNGDNQTAVNTLLNLSGTYSHLKQPERQYAMLQNALQLAKKDAAPESLGTIYNNLGDYYYQQQQFQPALNNYLQSYGYSMKLGNHFHLCTASQRVALMYHHLQRPEKALEFITQAERLALEVGARADLREIFKTRAEIEEQRGNYKLSNDYYAKTIILTDSLFKVESAERIAEIEAKYESEKKQEEILQLQKDKLIQSLSIKQKSSLNYFLIAALAASLIVGFLGYRNLRNRQLLARQQDELQQQRIRELEKDKQLVAVDSLLRGQEEERSRLAKDLHDGLGGLLSGVKFSLSNMRDNLIVTPENMAVFERSLDMIDTAIMELRRVAHNMMPEMLLKYGLDEALKEYCNAVNATKLVAVKYQSFGMNERLDGSVEIIIYRIIQELLNNVLKHAGGTEVLVQLIREGKRLSIVVEDNGKGFDPDTSETKGAGWTNIRSRVDYLKGQIEINAQKGSGTLVNIEINL